MFMYIIRTRSATRTTCSTHFCEPRWQSSYAGFPVPFGESSGNDVNTMAKKQMLIHSGSYRYLVPGTSKPAASLSLLSPAKAVKSSNLITGEIRKIQALMMVNYNHDDVEMALAPT